MADKKKDKDADKKRKKNTSASAAATLLEKETDYATGYETDAGPSTSSKKKLKFRKRAKAPGSAGGGVDGYETDDGYMSTPTSAKKTKSSKFFRLGNKSKSQLDENSQPKRSEAASPPPVFRLPIAERFATTLGELNAAATVDPPLAPPFLPPSTFTSPVSVTVAAKDTDAEAESSNAHGPQHSAVRFTGSDSSDHHESSSSGPSLFSKFTSSSSASSPTSSSMSHFNNLKIPTPSKAGNKRPDPLSLAPYPLPNSSGSKSVPTSRGPSPSPTGSPFVVLTPSDPSAPIPSEPNPPPSSRARGKFISRDISLKIGSAKSPQVVTIDTGRSKRIVASQAGSIIPSSEHLLSSSLGESLEPPAHTFSYYELPPPSPPPLSPLPKPPDSSSEDMGRDQASRFVYPPHKPSSASSATPSRPISPAFGGPIPRRGVEAPFPSRPVLPGAGTSTRGFEVRAKVERYRDIYAINPASRSVSPNQRPNLALNTRDMVVSPVATSAPPMLSGPSIRIRTPQANSKRSNRYAVAFDGRRETRVGISVEVPSDPEDDWEYGYKDDDSKAMHDVLTRFHSASERRYQPNEPALGRSRSFEALRENAKGLEPGSDVEPDDRSRYPEDDSTTLYTLSDAASRYSFLDQSKSETARQRFVDRIEAMFDENGRDKLPPREDAIPPVPKLPQGLVAAKTSGWF